MDGSWHKMVLQNYGESRSGSGHATRTYADYASVQIKLRTLSGNERLRAQQVQAVLTHEAAMVYSRSIQPRADWRLVWGDRTFEIKDVRNVDERNEEIRMTLLEIQTEGPSASASPSASPSSSASA